MADWIKPWKYCMHIKWMPLVELVECVCVLCVFFCFCLFIAWLPCCFSRLLQILQHFACVVNSHVCNPCNRGSASVCLWVPVSRLMRITKKRERATNRISLAQIHQTEISFERECRCGRARSQFASGHQINQDSLACVCMQLLYLFCCCCCLLLSNYFICLVYTKHKVRNACEFRLVDDREWARIFCAGLIGCYFMSFYHHY